jgi:hypothetical protein
MNPGPLPWLGATMFAATGLRAGYGWLTGRLHGSKVLVRNAKFQPTRSR